MSRLAPSLALACLLVGGLASVAHAETAEELFSKAEKAMEKKDYDAACAAFATSFQLSDGKGALYRLAQCDDARGGRLATQLDNWRRVRERFADKADIVAEADKRMAALDAQVAKVTLRRAAGAPQELKVELDGKPARLDEAIPVDAGSHEAVATSPNGETFREKLDVRDGEQRSVEVGAGAAKEPEPPPAPPPVEEDGGTSAFTVAGFVVGGVGIAGLTVFAISTPILAGASGDIDEACGADRTCSPTEARAAEAAKSDAEGWQVPNVVGLVAGVVGVGLGVTFLVIGANDDAPVEASVGPGNVAVRGSF